MWRRIYLLLLLVRLYFAVCPSYIHPDEHFQGPEVMAGLVFKWRTTKTWEFTSDTPIRSFFPLWLSYGMPMQLLHWIIPGDEPPSPALIFYTLRILFFFLSFVLGRFAVIIPVDRPTLHITGSWVAKGPPYQREADNIKEDWALQELIASPKQRRLSLLLLASSYVTWTYQTHTFSNSVETLLVAWSLVLIDRIERSKTTAWLSSALLGLTSALGIFNRITFPAFLLFPSYKLIPHFINHPGSILTLGLFAVVISLMAIYMDTLFHHPSNGLSLFDADGSIPVITPLNSLLYNSKTSNLSEHGLHPRYTHLLINLPQLLGPALIPIFSNMSLRKLKALPILSTISGIAVLSHFQHQEARFLIPSVPLLLTSVTLPQSPVAKRLWIALWIVFNVLYGGLMGMLHQAGVVPAQNYLIATNATDIVYWKSYPPPTWLLGSRNTHTNTIDLMGSPVSTLVDTLQPISTCPEDNKEAYLVAPLSATAIDGLTSNHTHFYLESEWSVRSHLNLDDMDFAEDGVIETVRRVWGRRGMGIWRVRQRKCVG